MIIKIVLTALLILSVSSFAFAAPYLQTSNPDRLNFHMATTDIDNGSDHPDYNGYGMNHYVHGDDYQISTVYSPPPAVPEPASLLLFGLGMAGAAVVRRFKK